MTVGSIVNVKRLFINFFFYELHRNIVQSRVIIFAPQPLANETRAATARMSERLNQSDEPRRKFPTADKFNVTGRGMRCT